MNEQSQRDYSSSEMYTSDTVRCEHCPIRATIIIQTDDEMVQCKCRCIVCLSKASSNNTESDVHYKKYVKEKSIPNE